MQQYNLSTVRYIMRFLSHGPWYSLDAEAGWRWNVTESWWRVFTQNWIWVPFKSSTAGLCIGLQPLTVEFHKSVVLQSFSMNVNCPDISFENDKWPVLQYMLVLNRWGCTNRYDMYHCTPKLNPSQINHAYPLKLLTSFDLEIMSCCRFVSRKQFHVFLVLDRFYHVVCLSLCFIKSLSCWCDWQDRTNILFTLVSTYCVLMNFV